MTKAHSPEVVKLSLTFLQQTFLLKGLASWVTRIKTFSKQCPRLYCAVVFWRLTLVYNLTSELSCELVNLTVSFIKLTQLYFGVNNKFAFSTM